MQELAGLRQQVASLEAAEEAHRRVEDALREQGQHLQLVLETSGDGFWDWEITTDRIRFSPRCLELLNYRAEELVPCSSVWQQLIHPDDLPAVTNALENHLVGKTPQVEIEHRLLAGAGEWKWVLARGRLVSRDGQGWLVCTWTDVTERKAMEEVLQQRNCELALLNHASQAFNSTLDLDQVLTTILSGVRYLLNVTACSIWLVEPETGELVCRQASGPYAERRRGWRLAPGQGIAGWVVRQGQSLVVADIQTDERQFELEQPPELELHSVLSIPLWAKERVIGALELLDAGVGRFDTMNATLVESLAATAAIAIENARLYEETRQAVEAKSILLHEVNHRVKNNLSLIIGLLYAELRHADDQNRAPLEALVSRVQGLATAHHLLSNSEWAPLPLDSLVTQILDFVFKTLPDDKHVLRQVVPAQVRVSPKQASSLALVLSELATNVVKHTLTKQSTTHMSVRIDTDAGNVSLQFRDDGPGYPEAVLNLEHRNVGLYLVEAIVRNDLRGELNLANDSGAVTTLRFRAV